MSVTFLEYLRQQKKMPSVQLGHHLQQAEVLLHQYVILAAGMGLTFHVCVQQTCPSPDLDYPKVIQA